MNNNYLQTIKENSLQKKDEEENYVIFLINNKKYAINIQNVIEIISIPLIEIPEKMPYATVGIFNYKGIMTKVIDLCPLLGFNTPMFSLNNKLIMLSNQKEIYSIITQDIIGINTIKKELIQSVPYSLDSSILNQVFKINDETVNVIDFNSLDKIIIENKDKENLINYSELFPIDEKTIHELKCRNNNQTIKETHSFNFNIIPQNQYVLFTLGNNNFYVELKYVKEFSSAMRIPLSSLPFVPDYIRGIVNVKGEFLVVVNLLYLLNRTNAEYKEPKNPKIIVIEGRNFNIALFVDDIKGIQNLNEIHPASYNNGTSEYIYSEFINENQLYSIINIEKIMDDERLYINIE